MLIWEFDQRRSGKFTEWLSWLVVKSHHKWKSLSPIDPPPPDACIAIMLTSINHSRRKFFPHPQDDQFVKPFQKVKWYSLNVWKCKRSIQSCDQKIGQCVHHQIRFCISYIYEICVSIKISLLLHNIFCVYPIMRLLLFFVYISYEIILFSSLQLTHGGVFISKS